MVQAAGTGLSGPGKREAWFTVLTPASRGAIAVVRVWGPDAVGVCDELFRPLGGKRLSKTAAGRARVGRLGQGLGDEVVAIVGAGEPGEVEIQCHGGTAAVALVTECLESAGACAGSASEFLRQGGWLRLEAEAWLDLGLAATLRSASVLLDQASGAFRREVEEILMLLESQPGEAAERLGALAELGRVGVKLREGWDVVLTGRPNVGKSRLLNAMAGFDRAIVAPTPGTTRDVVASATAVNGWPVAFHDTAGLREPGDEVEAQGVKRAIERARRADLRVLVLDVSRSLGKEDEELLERLPDAVVVANKCDLEGAWESSSVGARAVSALTGEGIEELLRDVGERLVDCSLPGGAGVPFRGWQLRAVWRSHRWFLGGRVQEARGELERLLSERGG